MIWKQGIYLLPKIGIFNGILIGRFPAPFLPALKPFRNPFLDVLRVCPKLNCAALFEGFEGKNDSANLHAVIGSELFTPVNVLFMTAGSQDSSPASGSRIAFAGSICINHDMRMGFGMRHGNNLLGIVTFEVFLNIAALGSRG